MPKTILLADDSATIRRIVELTFTDTEFRLESVATGAEALPMIESLRPDLVLADVVMPEPTGYELCRTIKNSGKAVPVLLLAGTFEPFDSEQARACGADGHLVKPFESQALLERVQALLDPPEPEPTFEEQLDAEVDEAASVLGASESEAPGEAEGDADVESVDPSAVDESIDVAIESRDPDGFEVRLSTEEIDAIADVVIERMTDHVVRDLAGKLLPELTERLVRERIRELEDES